MPQEQRERDWPQLLGDPRLFPHDVELPAREKARRSWVAVRDLEAGEMVTADDVIALRPGGGLEPWHTPAGKVVTKRVYAGEALTKQSVV